MGMAYEPTRQNKVLESGAGTDRSQDIFGIKKLERAVAVSGSFC